MKKTTWYLVGSGLLGVLASVLSSKSQEEKIKNVVDERILELSEDEEDSEEESEEES